MSFIFEYKVLTSTGEISSGELEADNRGLALKELQEKGTLLDLVQREAMDSGKKGWSFPILEFSKIRPAQLAFLFRQLGELLDAGLPLVSALSSLQKFCGNQKTRNVLADVSKKLRQGQTLSAAMSAQQGVFTKMQIAMIQVGERSGNLPEVLHRTADLLDAQLELRGKVRSALAYPFFVLFFSTLLCWGLVTFLLPEFEPIWTASKLDLSAYPVTEALMAVSKFTRNPVDELLVFVFLTFITLAFTHLSSVKEGQNFVGDMLLRIPILGNYLLLSATSELSTTLALLLDSGMPLPESLDLASSTAGNPVIAKALAEAATSVREGNDFSASVNSSGVFPDLFVQMVSVGETSGNLPSLLQRVSTYYSRQLDDSLKSLTSLIEPVTMAVIGGIVFVFVLGVFLPIMGIVSALSSS